MKVICTKKYYMEREVTMDRRLRMTFYKSRNGQFGDIDKKREGDNKKMKIERQDRRTRMFNSRRSIAVQENTSDDMSNEGIRVPEDNKVLDRKLALLKYKQERETLKQALNNKKRPPFVVGIPHHGNSPVLKDIANKFNFVQPKQNCHKTENVKSQRATRANTKLEREHFLKNRNVNMKSPVRVFPFNERKSMFTFQLNKGTSVKKLTSPHTPVVLKRSARKGAKTLGGVNNNGRHDEKQNPKPPGKLLIQSQKKSSVSSTDSGQPLAAPLPDSERPNELINTNIDDAVESLEQDQEIPIKTELVENLESQSSELEKSIYRERVDKESERLMLLAEEWEATSLSNNIPQDVVDEIDSVVGQTRLLVRDKFNQYRGLVDQYETKQGSQKITVEDLDGFWDMVYLQVEPLIKRYVKLEVLKNNNWEEPKPATPPKKKKRGPVKKNVKKEQELQSQKKTEVPLASISETARPTPRRSRTVSPVINTEDAAYTPRRSTRLMGKNPTPLICSSCKSPDCKKFHIKSEKPQSGSRRSRKIVAQSFEEGNLMESSISEDVQLERVGETNKSSKKFVLRPSKLVWNDPSNKSPGSSTKFALSNLVWNDPSNKSPGSGVSLRRKSIKIEEEENSPLNVGNKESSDFIRRSTRLASAKKVTFNTSREEKTNSKLPATPYAKKGQQNTSSSESFSD